MARDDLIVAVDGRNLSSPAGLDRALRDLGDRRRVTIRYERRGEPMTATVEVVPDPARELVSLEQLGRRPTAVQSRFRGEWLGSRVGRTAR